LWGELVEKKLGAAMTAGGFFGLILAIALSVAFKPKYVKIVGIEVEEVKKK